MNSKCFFYKKKEELKLNTYFLKLTFFVFFSFGIFFIITFIITVFTTDSLTNKMNV